MANFHQKPPKKHSHTKILIYSILPILFHLFQTSVQASILINEVYPYPDSSNPSDREWIELINTNYSIDNSFTSQTPPNLTNYTLWDTTSSPSLLFTFTEETIFSDQFFTIDISNKLNNSGDGVVLKDNLGQIIDQMSYSSSQLGKSWTRIPNTIGNFVLVPPTKNQSNPPLAPTPSPSPLPPSPAAVQTMATPSPITTNSPYTPTLSEIMACPTQGSEWIEIYNPHQDFINLEGYSLHDSQNEIYSFSTADTSISQEIASGSYLTIEINNKLNNSGDQIILKNLTQEIVAEMNYENCTKGSSWIWHENQWLETLTTTKNTPNNYSGPTVTPSPTPKISPTQKPISATPGTQTTIKKTIYPIPNTPYPILNTPYSIPHTQYPIPNTKYLNSPPYADHLFFYPTDTKKNRLISVIIGGLVLITTGSYVIYDHYKYDFDKT